MRGLGTGKPFRRPESPYWFVGYMVGGRYVRESTKSTKRSDAVALLKTRLKEIENGTFVGATAEKVTVDELLSDLSHDYELKGRPSLRTLGKPPAPEEDREATGHIKTWLNVIGGMRAKAGSLPVFTEIATRWQRAGVMPATINKRMASLKRAYRLGREAGKVKVVPTFPRLPEHNARKGFFDWPTFVRVLDALPNDGLRDFVEWLARTGMRKGEAARLTWADYDKETGVIRLHGKDAKSGKPRRIVLVGPLADIIARRWEARKKRPDVPYIFNRRNARKIGDVRKSWALGCKAAGVTAGRDGFTPQDLRRTAVRNMVRAGVSQTVAMRISGHLTDSMFRRYDITSDEDLQEAMEKTVAYTNKLAAEGTKVRRATSVSG